MWKIVESIKNPESWVLSIKNLTKHGVELLAPEVQGDLTQQSAGKSGCEIMLNPQILHENPQCKFPVQTLHLFFLLHFRLLLSQLFFTRLNKKQLCRLLLQDHLSLGCPSGSNFSGETSSSDLLRNMRIKVNHNKSPRITINHQVNYQVMKSP